jgi:hypothetical protein
MEMLIIAVVAVIAFAAVLVPLFRRGQHAVDGDEFNMGEPPDEGTRPAAATKPVVRRNAQAEREVESRPEGTAAGEGVVPPMAAGPGTPVAPAGAVLEDAPAAGPAPAPDDIELEVSRYRTALRAGTVCSKCGQANPADSSFCFECGAQLPLKEAREFD